MNRRLKIVFQTISNIFIESRPTTFLGKVMPRHQRYSILLLLHWTHTPHLSKYKAHGPKVLLPSNRNVPLYTRGVAKRGAKGVVEVMPLGAQEAHPIFICWPLIVINIATFEYLVQFLLKVFII
jgi:hypothetical protein